MRLTCTTSYNIHVNTNFEEMHQYDPEFKFFFRLLIVKLRFSIQVFIMKTKKNFSFSAQERKKG